MILPAQRKCRKMVADIKSLMGTILSTYFLFPGRHQVLLRYYICNDSKDKETADRILHEVIVGRMKKF